MFASISGRLATLALALTCMALGAQTRSQQNLSGTWDFRFDPQTVGEAQHWYAPSAAGNWEKAKVPGSYDEQFAHHPLAPEPSDTARFYYGAAWYRTTFHVHPEKHVDQILHLQGAVLRQKVWVNGQLAGASDIPYMDVAYNITPMVHDGENTLVVEVDNRVLQRAIPDAKWRGWWNDGGLIRPVVLEQRPMTRSNTHYTTTMQPDGGWKLNLTTDVVEEKGEPNAQLEYRLLDASGHVVWQHHAAVTSHAAASESQVSVSLPHVASWSPDHPTLYRMEVRTTTKSEPGLSDLDSMHVGFREIKVEGTRLLLNGEQIQLRGINRHQFLAGAGMSLTVAEDRKDMTDIKRLGANFTRLAHYSQSEDVYDACDELGLLVWTEIPAWQTAVDTLADPEVWTHDAVPQLRAMVEQHRNHPSVIIYSVANEIPSDKPAGAAYVTKAISFVHSLDDSRLATFASDKRERDLAFGAVDIIAVNEYFGWYYGSMNDVGPMLDNVHAKFPGKPIIVSEYGSEAVPGWNKADAHPDSKGVVKDYSVEYQAKLLGSHMEQIYAPERRSFVAGGTIWVYADFPDPHRLGGDHPDIAKYRNNKGLVTMDRTRKPAYNTVDNFFHQLAAQQAERAPSAQPAELH